MFSISSTKVIDKGIYAKRFFKDILNFFVTVLETHNVERSDDVFIDFFDNNMAPIPHDMLYSIIKQFGQSGSFYVELVISGETNKSITQEVKFFFIKFKVINPKSTMFQQLESYLKVRENCDYMFIECKRLGRLNKRTRLKLMTVLVCLIDDEFGGHASEVEIGSICRATIAAFPSLEGVNAEIGKIVIKLSFIFNQNND